MLCERNQQRICGAYLFEKLFRCIRLPQLLFFVFTKQRHFVIIDIEDFNLSIAQ